MDERDFAGRWQARFRSAAYDAAKARGETDGRREYQGLLDEGANRTYAEEAAKGHRRPKSLLDRAMEDPKSSVAGVPIPAADRLGNVDGAETPEFQADYERRRAAVRDRLRRLHQNRSDAGDKTDRQVRETAGAYKGGKWDEDYLRRGGFGRP